MRLNRLLVLFCLCRFVKAELLTYFIYKEAPAITLQDSGHNFLKILIDVKNEGSVSNSLIREPPNEYALQYLEGRSTPWRKASNQLLPVQFSHVLNISGLNPNTSYFFRAVGCYNYKDQDQLLQVVDQGILVTKPLRTKFVGDSTLDKSVELSYHNNQGANEIDLFWNIKDMGYLGKQLNCKIKWTYTRRGCYPTVLNNESQEVSCNQSTIRINVEYYSKYNITLEINGFVNFQKPFSPEEIVTSILATVREDEKPVVKRIDAMENSALVYFEDFDCKKMRGPLYINYDAHTIEPSKCCNVTKFNYTTLPLNGNLLTIPGLIPYCNYTIRIVVSRHKNDWDRNKELYKGSIQTNAQESILRDVIIFIKSEILSSNNVTLILDNNTTCKKGPLFLKYRVLNVAWPQGDCYSSLSENYKVISVSNTSDLKVVINNLKPSCSYRLTMFLSRTVEGDTGISLRDYSFQTLPPLPKPPYYITVNWTSNYVLKVCWMQSDVKEERVTQFIVREHFKYGESLPSEKTVDTNFSIDHLKFSHKTGYCVNLEASFDRERKLSEFHVDVSTVNQAGRSDFQPTDIPIPPPEPKKYRKHLKVHGQTLTVSMPERDYFFNSLYVFGTSELTSKDKLEKEVATLSSDIENNKYNRNKKRLLKELLYIKNIYVDGIRQIQLSKILPYSAKYNLSMFVINEINNIRRVVGATQSVENDEVPTFRYVILVIVLVILFAFAGLGYFLYKLRQKIFVAAYGGEIVTYSNIDEESPLTDEKYDDNNIYGLTLTNAHSKRVKVEDLRSYIKLALETNELLRQHQLIPKSDVLMKYEPNLTCIRGNLPQNKTKNRYNNIVAYDHTRVKLQTIPGNEFSDYVNANYIDGYEQPKAYIAAQGPKPNTLHDFWRMIWENSVKYVMMLTNLYDDEKKVCEQYWPDSDACIRFGEFTIEAMRYTTYPTYHIRELLVRVAPETRKIIQLQFKSWPSIGQPLFPQTLVPLLQQMLTIPYSETSPVLVHCSAGVGRTGTIILCDICLRMIAAEGSVDVLGTLGVLRSQRPNMVENVEQYKLAHLVILATLTAWNTSIPLDGNFESAVTEILDNTIHTQMKYIRKSEWQDDAMKTVATAVQRHVPTVQVKNRFPDILPDEFCQVFLQQLPNHDSNSCYINAIWVNSFLLPKRYIVTQHPLSATVADFWKLVMEQMATVIVNLNPVDSMDQTSVPFWPEKQSRVQISDNLLVQHIKSVWDKEMSIHTLRAIYRPNDYEQTNLTLEILSFNGWQSGRRIAENIDDFLSFVIDVSSVAKKALPVIITCHDGATASGVFVALSNVIEQMETEKVCDICQIIRTIKIYRKQFVNEEIQLRMLYEAVLRYSRNLGEYCELNN